MTLSASTKKLDDLLSEQAMLEVQHWIKKYPDAQRQSAVMAVLRIVQEAHSYLTPALMDAVAVYLNMPSIAVYEVASFYSMYEHRGVGRNIINVCTNISCKLRGSAEILSALEQKLNITAGQTTADQRFTLRSVECLGACVNAPMMQINKIYH